MGEDEGPTLGVVDGSWLGTEVDGSWLGSEDGEVDGTSLGVVDGSWLGTEVDGSWLGTEVGKELGDEDGEPVFSTHNVATQESSAQSRFNEQVWPVAQPGHAGPPQLRSVSSPFV